MLERDPVELGALLIAQLGGRWLPQSAAGDPAAVFALRYAELAAESLSTTARLTGDPTAQRAWTSARKRFADQFRSAEQRIAAPARPIAAVVPNSDLYKRLVKKGAGPPPPEVRDLLAMDDTEFATMVAADARSSEHNHTLVHPALAARLAPHARIVHQHLTVSLSARRQKLRNKPRMQWGAGEAERLRADGLSCARAKIRYLAADWTIERMRSELGDPPTPPAQPRTWETVLHQVHLDGSWCEIPDDLAAMLPKVTKIGFGLVHPSHGVAGADGEQRHWAGLRRRAGDWELTGIAWPEGLPPGTVMTLTWSGGDYRITGRTALLPEPVRIGGVDLLHRYDPGVLLRELLPGGGRGENPRDLSARQWVLRTLCALGHISENGTVVLSESTLRRNCRELGMPAARADEVAPAVSALIRAARIQRVTGSVDGDGELHWPRRAGERAVDLLRYVPPREKLSHDQIRRAEAARIRSYAEQTVTDHLRHLPDGHEASAEKQEEYLALRRQKGLPHQPLPPGTTLVSKHQRRPGPQA